MPAYKCFHYSSLNQVLISGVAALQQIPRHENAENVQTSVMVLFIWSWSIFIDELDNSYSTLLVSALSFIDKMYVSILHFMWIPQKLFWENKVQNLPI